MHEMASSKATERKALRLSKEDMLIRQNKMLDEVSDSLPNTLPEVMENTPMHILTRHQDFLLAAGWTARNYAAFLIKQHVKILDT